MTEKLKVFEIDLTKPIPPRWRGSWGGWRLYDDHLEYGGRGYSFNLSNVTSSAAVLDKIMQIAGKTWATDECLAGLVRALDDIFHPQALLCSCGGDKRITARDARARLDGALKLQRAFGVKFEVTTENLPALVETLAVAVDAALAQGTPFDDVVLAAVAVLADAVEDRPCDPRLGRLRRALSALRFAIGPKRAKRLPAHRLQGA